LRALDEEKSAAFYRAQSGRSLQVLTLRHTSHANSAGWTPAISSNYLHVRLPGEWPANQMIPAVTFSGGTRYLNARPETSDTFAV
jgi:hypothetical protein